MVDKNNGKPMPKDVLFKITADDAREMMEKAKSVRLSDDEFDKIMTPILLSITNAANNGYDKVKVICSSMKPKDNSTWKFIIDNRSILSTEIIFNTIEILNRVLLNSYVTQVKNYICDTLTEKSFNINSLTVENSRDMNAEKYIHFKLEISW